MTPMQRLEVENTGVGVARPDWLSEGMWRQCQHAEATLPAFSSLCVSLLNNTPQWAEFERNEDVYHLLSRPWIDDNPGTADTVCGTG